MHNLREGSNFYVKAKQNESKTKPDRKKTGSLSNLGTFHKTKGRKTIKK